MQNREQWGSKLGFILAAAGSAVGIGNIWKFPYIAGENGGAAFTLVYLLCILVVGLTIVIAEFAIGRSTQLSPVGAFENFFNRIDYHARSTVEVSELPLGALIEIECIAIK